MNRERHAVKEPQPEGNQVYDYRNGADPVVESWGGQIRTGQPEAPKRLALLEVVWRGWLKFSQILGTFQMVVILTLFYWIALPVMAIPFKILADPLRLRRPDRASWVERESGCQTVDRMKQQY